MNREPSADSREQCSVCKAIPGRCVKHDVIDFTRWVRGVTPTYERDGNALWIGQHSVAFRRSGSVSAVAAGPDELPFILRTFGKEAHERADRIFGIFGAKYRPTPIEVARRRGPR